MAPSPMVRRKSPETKTKTRLRKRNSQSRQRSTRNQRWSQWKTSSPSAADLEPTPCKAYWAAQLFLKFCATSFDDAGSQSSRRRHRNNRVLAEAASSSITKSITVPSTLLLRGTESRVDKDAIVPRAPKIMSDHLTFVIAVLQHQRFQSLVQIVQPPRTPLPTYAVRPDWTLRIAHQLAVQFQLPWHHFSMIHWNK